MGVPSPHNLKAETAPVSTPPPTVFRFLYRSRHPSATRSAARLLRWRDYPCQLRGAQRTRRGLLRANPLAAISVTEITSGDGESSTGIGKTKSYAVREDLFVDCLWEGLLSPAIDKPLATRWDLFPTRFGSSHGVRPLRPDCGLHTQGGYVGEYRAILGARPPRRLAEVFWGTASVKASCFCAPTKNRGLTSSVEKSGSNQSWCRPKTMTAGDGASSNCSASDFVSTAVRLLASATAPRRIAIIIA